MFDAHTHNAVDKYVGRVTLQLPAYFRQELDGAIDRGISQMPGKSREELKNLVAASVALTLRASNFAEVVDAEIQRELEAQANGEAVRDMQRLDMLKRRHAEAVTELERVVFNRRKAWKTVRAAFIQYLKAVDLLDEYDARPLRAYGMRIFEKRQHLEGQKEAAK